MRYTCIFGLCLFTLLSCNGRNKRNIDTRISPRHDTSVRRVLYTEDSIGSQSRQSLFLKNVAGLIGLPKDTLNDAQLFRVRIWNWYPDKSYVVDLELKDGVSRCTILEFNSEKIDNAEHLVIHNQWNNVTPESGWNSLWPKIDEYKITTLAGGKPYGDLDSVPAHGSYVQFEITRNGNYRFFEYLEPSYYMSSDIDSKRVVEFLKYLNNQMPVVVYK